MGKKSAPAAPNPKETASASTSTNVGTAVANAYLGNVNQKTPDGSLSYAQTGSYKWSDPYTGKTYDIPTFTATQTLSPQQQAIKGQSDAASLNLGRIANEQTGFLRNYLNKPVDLSNEATEARLMALGRKRLDPLIKQRDEELRTRLANQGIKAGSDAYSREMTTQNQSENDAYNQLLLTGRQQAVNEALTERNQPLNEISALMSGSQVQQPNYVSANMPTIATTDVAGLINQNYQNQLGAWQQKNAATQNVLGGLFGLGAAGIMAPSDERVKKDVKKVGRLMGHNLYEFEYTGKFADGQKHVGVIAQEAEKKRPDAVLEGSDGVKRVDYGRLFEMGKKTA